MKHTQHQHHHYFITFHHMFPQQIMCSCLMVVQRESMVMRRGDDSDFKDKMSKKNKELTEYLDEIKVINYLIFCVCTDVQ